MPSAGRCLTVSILLLAASVAARPGSCEAADWAFRRSYFSHDVPPELAAAYPTPVSYSAYRPAVVSPYPGFSIRGTRRFNRVLIQSGSSLDATVLRSDDFQIRP